MAKKSVDKSIEDPFSIAIWHAQVRMPVCVAHREIDTHMETVQGQEQSIRKLVEDYVLGRLDPRQLGGGSYDADGSDEVDPFNAPGLTYEEATQISDAGRSAAREMKQRKRTVADHPRESSEHEDEGGKSRVSEQDVSQ